MNSTTNYSLSRRVTQQISKAIRYWKEDTTDGYSSKSSCRIYEERKFFTLDELVAETKFSRKEIQVIYRDFKQKCPRGILTEKYLVEIYSQYFSCGDCSIFARHLFSALVNQHYSTHVLFFQNTTKVKRNHGFEINFQQFLITLSTLTRGTLDDRIKWIFNFYDLKKDGKITSDEVSSMINSIYDLMGKDVSPPADEISRNKHIDFVLKKMGLTTKESSLTYEEFYRILINHQELIDSMMKI